MTDQGDRTEVYAWAGPPRISVSTQSVEHQGRRWVQHRVDADEGGIGVVVVATFAGKHLIVEHFRPVTGSTLTEFPRGFGTQPPEGRTPQQHACNDGIRELLEETGLQAETAEFLGYVWPDSGILGSKVAVVAIAAQSQEPVQSNDGEIDRFRWATKEELARAIVTGEIADGITLAAYALWCAAK
ncbi:NUDIX hydrolase [Arthrobacter sp. BF1]|uniref:NUDIX hydrolase n=1 Tax=Arthrobacter sp. BF1 TaxID=2821145 RepID=UPI001C4E7115|nr:NUDIX hydrolase [Arthrobacter sp. BF1]